MDQSNTKEIALNDNEKEKKRKRKRERKKGSFLTIQ